MSKWQRAVCRGSNLLASLLLAFCWTGHAETLRFVVAGDGRAEYPWNGRREPPAEDIGGINQAINKEICKAVIDEQAKIMLWTGDIVNVSEGAGSKPDDKTRFLKNGLNAWRKIMQPLYDKHVTVLPVRGNYDVEWHERKDRTPNEIAGATAVWREVFPELPDNGPDCEKKLSYYYATDSVLFIGLDQYENRRHMVHQSWLDEQVLTAKNKRPFIFAYGHEPAFVPGSLMKTVECLAAYPHRRDQMWESLSNAGARVYFCGHDHFYDHMKVQRGTTPSGPEMHQLTAGTAGAPLYPHLLYPKDEDWKLERVNHCDFLYGYILVAIDGNTATIVFKGRNPDGQYEAKDSFTYTVNTP